MYKRPKQPFEFQLPIMESKLIFLNEDNQDLKNKLDEIEPAKLSIMKIDASSNLDKMHQLYFAILGRFDHPSNPEANEIFGVAPIPPKDVLDRMLTLCKQIAKISRENLRLMEN